MAAISSRIREIVFGTCGRQSTAADWNLLLHVIFKSIILQGGILIVVSVTDSERGELPSFDAQQNSIVITENCPPGTFLTLSKGSEYSNVANIECAPCPQNTFNSLSGQVFYTSCIECSGSTTSGPGSAQCVSVENLKDHSVFIGLVCATAVATFGLVLTLLIIICVVHKTPLCFSRPGKPTSNPIAIVVGSAKDCSELRNLYPREMRRIFQEYTRHVRKLVTKHGGHLDSVEIDDFLALFHNSYDATAFALDLQEALLVMDYPLEILTFEAMCVRIDKEGRLINRGLRVATAVHLASLSVEQRIYRAPIYCGHGLNAARNLLNFAQGGQVLLSSTAYSGTQEHLNDMEQSVTLRYEGTHPLSIDENPTPVYSIAFPSMTRREFHPIVSTPLSSRNDKNSFSAMPTQSVLNESFQFCVEPPPIPGQPIQDSSTQSRTSPPTATQQQQVSATIPFPLTLSASYSTNPTMGSTPTHNSSFGSMAPKRSKDGGSPGGQLANNTASRDSAESSLLGFSELGSNCLLSAEKELLLTERVRQIFPKTGMRLVDASEALAYSVCFSDKPHFRALVHFALWNLIDISSPGGTQRRMTSKSLITSSCRSGEADRYFVQWRHISVALRDIPTLALKIAFLRGLRHIIESRYRAPSITSPR